MNNLNIDIDMKFSEQIFNDSGNGDIEFDVSDYNPNFDIKLNELTIVVLIQLLEDYFDNHQSEPADDVHLNKKQRK